MANQNAQIKELTHTSRAAFVTATSAVTDPIMAFITATPKEIGLKYSGSYFYWTLSDEQIAALQAQIDANTTSIAALTSIISGSYGAITRGQLSVPDAGDAAATSVPYEELTDEQNPMTCAKCKIFGTLKDLTFYISTVFLESLGKSDALIEDTVFWVVNVPGDADALYLYDTFENAEAAGTTGRLAEFDTIPEATPGTWPIKQLVGGSLTGVTLGWMYAPIGVYYGQHSVPLGAYLLSRDFSFTAAELLPGFEAEIPFRLKFGGGAPVSDLPGVVFGVKTKGGTITLNDTAAVQSIDGATEEGVVVGKVNVTVVARYTVADEDTVRIRTTVSFDDVTGWDATANAQFRTSPTVVEEEVLVSDLGTGYCFLDLYGVGYDNVTDFEFISSSMNVRYPVVIP
jgi:hypothetical protein